MYVTYIDSVIGHLQQRFEPWPEWLVLCEHSFNFLNDIEDSDRKIAFEKLLDMPHGINTLVADEKLRLKTEYQTMLVNSTEVVTQLNGIGKVEKVWYRLLTEEVYYRNCKYVNYLALQFLNHSFKMSVLLSQRFQTLKTFNAVVGP